MSRQVFALLAAGVTVGGLVLVVAAAHLLLRTQSPRVVRPVAWTLLLGYAALLLVRPSAWMAIDLSVLAGAVGGVLLLESGLRTPGAVAAFVAIAASIDLMACPILLLVWRHSRRGSAHRVPVPRRRAGS